VRPGFSEAKEDACSLSVLVSRAGKAAALGQENAGAACALLGHYHSHISFALVAISSRFDTKTVETRGVSLMENSTRHGSFEVQQIYFMGIMHTRHMIRP
jgi:hypothetical protein